MKKYKSILHILALAILAVSCAKQPLSELKPVMESDALGYEHDGKVTFGFNPDFSHGGTKAMVEGADIKNIYVAVFDAVGFKLSEYTKATQVSTGDDLDNDTDYQYTVELKVSDSSRIIHIIANAPEDIRFGSENEVIGEMFTKHDNPDTQEGGFRNAYWQRLVFDSITPRPKGDDPDSLAAYTAVRDKLNNVKLIRNYSKVTVQVNTESCTNFEMSGFWFVNEPDRGSIAPYNRNTGGFVTDYLDYPTVESLEGPSGTDFIFNSGTAEEYSLPGGNYQGFMLASTEFVTPSLNEDNKHTPVDGACTGYVYEREKALSSPLYLIVEGNYRGSTDKSYYKIAMQGGDGSFYAMLRNFNYLVRIEGVSTSGYPSPAAAMAGAPSGDISVNVDYQELPNISDGDARISVNATTLMIIGRNGESTSAELLYKYEPDITEHANKGICNNWVVEDPLHPVAINHVTIVPDTPGSTGPVIESFAVEYCYVDGSNVCHKVTVDKDGNLTDTPIDEDDFDGFGHIFINTTAVGSLPKNQTLTITGKQYVGSGCHTITRTVNLVLRETLELSLSAAPNTDMDGNAWVEKGEGKQVVINLGIDGGLPSSMFPMEFKIEPTVKSLTPDITHSGDQELPVRYGKDSDGYPTYWFEKIINWTEYSSNTKVVDGRKTFPIYLSTILAESGTTVKVTQPDFAPASVVIGTYVPKKFSNLKLSSTSHKVGVIENFSFDMSDGAPEDGIVTVAMKGIEPNPSSAFEYVGKDSDGFWLYKLSGVSGTHMEFNVAPYAEGTIEIKLSALKFSDASISAEAIDPYTKLYVNMALSGGTGDSVVSFTSTNLDNSKLMLVPGQHVTLTFYILDTAVPQGSAVSISGGGQAGNATRTNSTITVGGSAFRKYTATYTVGAEGNDISRAYIDPVRVYVNSSVIGSFSLPVYGMSLGDQLTSVSFDTQGYYVIENNASGRYLYNKESTTNASQILRDTWDFSSLVQFSNTTSTSKVQYVKIGSGNTYYLYGNVLGGSTIGLSTNSYSWSITNGANGFRLYYDGMFSDYYIYDNGGNPAALAISGDSATEPNRYWNIYPIIFTAPEE